LLPAKPGFVSKNLLPHRTADRKAFAPRALTDKGRAIARQFAQGARFASILDFKTEVAIFYLALMRTTIGRKFTETSSPLGYVATAETQCRPDFARAHMSLGEAAASMRQASERHAQTRIAMWEQYKRTFWPVQLVIALITLAVAVWSHVIGVGAVFFCVMQMGAAIGAAWATRLRSKFL
jgi:hypothetical protein